MKLGIMQPYFFPYIGYWQLINLVDVYIVYDDVNFIKGGWIHRNRILIDGKPHYINMQMVGMSSNKKINQIALETQYDWKSKCAKTIEMNYKKAPFFKDVMPILEMAIKGHQDNIAKYIYNTIAIICDYLEISTNVVLSSELNLATNCTGKERVIEICRTLGASQYFNAIGGTELYDKQEFAKNGISLAFLKTGEIKYQQFGEGFYENLSIIDVLMFNSKDQVKKLLDQYTLI